MTKPTLPAFDPADLAESNATGYPEPFREANGCRWVRRLGNHVGLANFGVNLVRVVPGGQSSARHTHCKQDEFMMLLSGELVLETDEGTYPDIDLAAGFGLGGRYVFTRKDCTPY